MIDDEDIIAHRRPRLELRRPDEDDEDDLSDYVKIRLALARHLALEKFDEKWGNIPPF